MKIISSLAICLLFIWVNPVTGQAAAEKTDKTPPVIKIAYSTKEATNKNIKLTVRVTDASEISLLKWEKGSRKTSYFSKDGKKLTLKNGKTSVTIKENNTYTFFAKDKKGNTTIKKVTVRNIDKTEPSVKLTYSVMNQKASVTIRTSDEQSGVEKVQYLKGKYDAAAENWETSGKTVANKKSFQTKTNGYYTVRVTDAAGNSKVSKINIEMEVRAVWVSFLEFQKSKGYSEAKFKEYIDTMFDTCASLNMNTVIVQVRPFGDAMYSSKYFPWSSYASGKQGVSPGYDPLAYMVESAHKKGLKIEAWINPYRVSADGSIKALSDDNQAKIWRGDDATKRNVLSYGGKLYYNPAVKEVRTLIINGVKEIVKNYDVDGIHFDDYFYPNLGTNYKNNFDAAEYQEYAASCKTTPKSIADWRRNNISTLVKDVYSSIKAIRNDCVFGISPAGSLSNITSDYAYYVDIEKWMSSKGYVDYICPQIYWSFQHKTAAFDKVTDNWVRLKTSKTVNLYLGLAAYRAGISKSEAKSIGDVEWGNSSTVLKRQIEYGRNTGIADGYFFFRYEHIISEKAKKEMNYAVSLF